VQEGYLARRVSSQLFLVDGATTFGASFGSGVPDRDVDGATADIDRIASAAGVAKLAAGETGSAGRIAGSGIHVTGSGMGEIRSVTR
jgi:hypothetical protein